MDAKEIEKNKKSQIIWNNHILKGFREIRINQLIA